MSYISAVRKGDDIIVWERTEDGERTLNNHRAPYYFFTKDPKGKHVSIYGDKLTRHDFATNEEYNAARSECRGSGVEMFESDLPPELKFLSERYYQVPAPKLHITFLDIEVDYNTEIGFSSVDNPYAPINSIAMYHQWEHRMVLYAVPPDGQTWTEESLSKKMNEIEEYPDDTEIEVYLCENEKELLLSIIGEIEDADLIAGWNSDFFDVPYIAKRLERTLGMKYFDMLSFPHAGRPKYREVEMFGRTNTTIDLHGRISCDYLALFKKYEMAERPSYKLESIADEMLPDLPKLEYNGTLADLYRNDFAWFCRYNLRDTEVLKGFEEKLGYVALANEMYHLSTGLWKHVTGTLKLAELAINNYIVHEMDMRFPDMGDPEQGSIAGAFVLEPKTGMHDWIGSIDINSLYPSAIRSINISPETLIGQFDDCAKAAENIAKGTMVTLVLAYEDGSEEEYTGEEWRSVMRERKWAISGFGTVFSQEKKGIIPAILEDWYATRKKYQALKAEAEDKGKKSYYDRLQYVYKIKLNSLYGALNNAYFRYSDLRMGESTTGTGRAILRHQCAKTNEVMTGVYDASGEAVLYGDTDSTYFALFAENAEEAVVIADAAGEKVTASFQEFMRETFLCQPGFDDIIKAGREVVASRGIFVEKKRYILRVIDNEGEKVDKLKVMGLDTKKTTIPPAVGKKLNEYVGRLLKGEEWADIANDIVEFKHYIETTDDIMAIGLPKGVNKVEEYTTNLEHDPNTRLPGHVAAAIHYNKMIEQHGDRVSGAITSGMKIKVFYLTKKYGKFKSIALPTDLHDVPEWFLENFTINRQMHIERLVDNPLGNIIKAIGKEVPTAQSLVVEDLLGF